MFILVEWLRHKDSRGQSFSCSYATAILCEWGKSSPSSISLFLCRYSGDGILAALDGTLQHLFYYFRKVHAITFKDTIWLL